MGVHRIDHSVTAPQKMILNVFGLTEDCVKNIIEDIGLKLKAGEQNMARVSAIQDMINQIEKAQELVSRKKEMRCSD